MLAKISSIVSKFHFNGESKGTNETWNYKHWEPHTHQMCLCIDSRFPDGIQRILWSIFFTSFVCFVSCQLLWQWWNAAQVTECKFLWNALCLVTKKVRLFFKYWSERERERERRNRKKWTLFVRREIFELFVFSAFKQTTLLFIHLYPSHANDSRQFGKTNNGRRNEYEQQNSRRKKKFPGKKNAQKPFRHNWTWW